MRQIRLLLVCICFCPCVQAQEFPKDFSVFTELGQGFNQPNGQSPLYLLTLQAVPQVTLVPQRLRLGVVLGGFYPATKVGVLAGPRLSLKLLEGPSVLTASSFNLHVLGEFLWATAPELANGRKLLGGGLGIGSSDLVTIAVKVHRELEQPATWFQVSIGYNVAKRKTPPL